MKITFPWPDKRLTPNAKRRTHWTVYRPAIVADRKAGHALTHEALSMGLRDLRAALRRLDTIPMTITFYPPDRRRRDDDGMISAFKHLRDGMADALAIDDSAFRPVYVFGEPEAPGRVEVTL